MSHGGLLLQVERSAEHSNSSRRLWWLTSVSQSVSSREVRLHDQDELDWTLPCEIQRSVCPAGGDGEKEARRNI